MAPEGFFDEEELQLYEQSPLNQQSQNFDMNTLALLLGIMQQVNKEKGDKAKPIDFINILESVLEQSNEKEETNEIQKLQK